MSISDRLREERKRLKLTQQAAADQAGVSREMWGRYEKGDALPGGEPLLGFALAGANIQYVLTGHYTDQALSGYEQELLRLFRAADTGTRAAILTLLNGIVRPSPGTEK
ncbi:helix-turn-helix transcriptional regulator [Chromobacterium sp. ASV23]|uniref:helix-turn-helix transcriptional regulator n=1 Tax=Chromobacterium sp. ASV23 TaxID=2795110 RepID=UPI0018EB3EBD|nr:helix-turn-helix domain-containing protein [Chromobacterium sp. ASV23]